MSFAADEKKRDTTPPTAEQKALVMSPAYQVYGATMGECLKEAIGVDPREAARKGDKAALSLDRAKILRMQDCMKAKGVDANFENYYGGGQDKDMSKLSPAQQAEIDAIQAKLDAAAQPAVAAPAPVQAPVMPRAVLAPAPQAVAPVPVPEKPAEKVEEKPQDSGAKTAKPPATQPKYWVKPGQ